MQIFDLTEEIKMFNEIKATMIKELGKNNILYI